MADYVEYSTRVATIPGPLTAQGATEWGFALEADDDKLEALCKKVFADPTGGEIDIRPLGHHVILTLGRIDKLVSDLPPFDTMGWSPEAQVDIWVPAARVERRGDRVVAEELLMFVPYIWIDNTISLPSGREIYGYPKAFGWASLPDPGADEATFGLDVFGMNFNRGESPRRERLIRITRGKDLPDIGGVSARGLLELGKFLRGLVLTDDDPGQAVRPDIDEIGRQLFADVRAGRLRQVFLKQIRAIDDGHKAALQQVTEATYKLIDMDTKMLAYEYHCTFNHLDSHPLGEELGLKDQTTTLAFRTTADFTLETGRVLWDSAGR